MQVQVTRNLATIPCVRPPNCYMLHLMLVPFHTVCTSPKLLRAAPDAGPIPYRVYVPQIVTCYTWCWPHSIPCVHPQNCYVLHLMLTPFHTVCTSPKLLPAVPDADPIPYRVYIPQIVLLHLILAPFHGSYIASILTVFKIRIEDAECT